MFKIVSNFYVREYEGSIAKLIFLKSHSAFSILMMFWDVIFKCYAFCVVFLIIEKAFFLKLKEPNN